MPWTPVLLIPGEYFICFSQVDIINFVDKFMTWVRCGFKELGDYGGMGIGATTSYVCRHPDFKTNPHKVRQQ